MNKARLAVPQNIRTKCLGWSFRAWPSLIFTACKLVLLSHFNIAKPFNDQVLLSPAIFD